MLSLPTYPMLMNQPRKESTASFPLPWQGQATQQHHANTKTDLAHTHEAFAMIDKSRAQMTVGSFGSAKKPVELCV